MIDINSIINNINTMFIAHYLTIESDVHSILIMKKDGGAFARMYWYDDDNKSIYLDSLSVNENYRNKGIGTKLQELREDIGYQLGFTDAYLVVDKNKWMKQWYERLRYTDYKEYDEKFIWMKKIINKN